MALERHKTPMYVVVAEKAGFGILAVVAGNGRLWRGLWRDDLEIRGFTLKFRKDRLVGLVVWLDASNVNFYITYYFVKESIPGTLETLAFPGVLLPRSGCLT